MSVPASGGLMWSPYYGITNLCRLTPAACGVMGSDPTYGTVKPPARHAGTAVACELEYSVISQCPFLFHVAIILKFTQVTLSRLYLIASFCFASFR
jgi:hypothetical protein